MDSMYIKPFRIAHLKILKSWDCYPPSLKIPDNGYVVIEDGLILSIGFLRLIEGDLAAVEGPFFDKDGYGERVEDAIELLETLFSAKADQLNVRFVRLKAYKQVRD